MIPRGKANAPCTAVWIRIKLLASWVLYHVLYAGYGRARAALSRDVVRVGRS